jgi:hypothetical protein
MVKINKKGYSIAKDIYTARNTDEEILTDLLENVSRTKNGLKANPIGEIELIGRYGRGAKTSINNLLNSKYIDNVGGYDNGTI